VAPNPQLLWEEVKGRYLASVGSRRAALLYEIWASPISEGDDPTPHLACIPISTFTDQCRRENISDRMLGYAMTVALHKTFATIKANSLVQRAPWLCRCCRSSTGGTGKTLSHSVGLRPLPTDLTARLQPARSPTKKPAHGYDRQCPERSRTAPLPLVPLPKHSDCSTSPLLVIL